LGDFEQGGFQPEISLAKEKVKVERERHSIIIIKKSRQNQFSAQGNHSRADREADEKHQTRLNMEKGEGKQEGV
jgi:hypothetical protein